MLFLKQPSCGVIEVLMRHTERIHWRIMEKLKILNAQRDEGEEALKNMSVRRDVSAATL